MLIHHDPDEHETVFDRRVCAHHQAHPGEPYAGCTCSSSISSRRRSFEEISAIKAKRLRDEEDRILALAKAIKVRRGLTEV